MIVDKDKENDKDTDKNNDKDNDGMIVEQDADQCSGGVSPSAN